MAHEVSLLQLAPLLPDWCLQQQLALVPINTQTRNFPVQVSGCGWHQCCPRLARSTPPHQPACSAHLPKREAPAAAVDSHTECLACSGTHKIVAHAAAAAQELWRVLWPVAGCGACAQLAAVIVTPGRKQALWQQNRAGSRTDLERTSVDECMLPPNNMPLQGSP